MLALHLRTNKKETVVGWYASAALGAGGASSSTSLPPAATPDLITDTSSLIHEFYAKEADEGEPVHLVVDTRLVSDAITARAYRSTPVVVQGEPMANMFHELRLTLQQSEPETLALHRMASDARIAAGATAGKGGNNEAAREEAEPLLVSMEKLHGLLEAASAYVDRVVAGELPPDAELGRKVSDTLATVPRIRPDVYDRLFNDALEDLLMVTYLSNITRTQLSVAEKLNASLGV